MNNLVLEVPDVKQYMLYYIMLTITNFKKKKKIDMHMPPTKKKRRRLRQSVSSITAANRVDLNILFDSV